MLRCDNGPELAREALAGWAGEHVTRASTQPPDSEQAKTQAASLAGALATGRSPRFAAAIAQSGPPDPHVRPHFDRLLDRVLDGLIGTGSAADAG